MSFHQYLNGVINLPSKNKQVQRIKDEIKKMLPLPSIHSQTKQDFNPIYQKLQQRKTFGNFYQTMSKKISLSLQTKPLFYSSLNKDFRHTTIDKKEFKPHKLPQQLYQQNSKEEEQESMRQWRQQMMSHIRPKKRLQNKSIQSQSALKQEKETKQIEQIVQSKIFNVKTSPSRLKKKKKLQSKPIFEQRQQLSHKNIILIKPTSIEDDKLEKTVERNKFQTFKLKKTMTIEKFYNFKNGIPSLKNQFNELALQKMANFEALLPFLGTRKAKVQNKSERKEIVYEVKQSIEQQNKKKRLNNVIQTQIRQQITGWQTIYD